MRDGGDFDKTKRHPYEYTSNLLSYRRGGPPCPPIKIMAQSITGCPEVVKRHPAVVNDSPGVADGRGRPSLQSEPRGDRAAARTVPTIRTAGGPSRSKNVPYKLPSILLQHFCLPLLQGEVSRVCAAEGITQSVANRHHHTRTARISHLPQGKYITALAISHRRQAVYHCKKASTSVEAFLLILPKRRLR